jgi:RimJ/RimL family protein N-acetyltransferase
MPNPSGAIRRKLSTARRMGPRAALERLTEPARQWIHLSEDHVWYELDLTAERPTLALPDRVRLARATASELHRVAELGRSDAEVESWHAEGHELWLALDSASDDLLFGCWIFLERAPAVAAPGGWLDLPLGAVCLEGGTTTRRARGGGIAPASIVAVADALQEAGVRMVITKIDLENEPARRTAVKCGFREIGVMHLRRLGPRKRVWFTSVSGTMGRELARQLGG